ncbi:putative Zn-dependent peptidase [Rubidibacter lacunae KORDI 51-2]|uniref:Putative Zn-dependent peptidase n=1 Tax=Rubidibacter lacunae KORDI 51-2 TaxID=582515 RepID=U5DPP5_9CHRO|nr:pitrilysin family protein [Rubidibacter lacunae]ERN42569.1 putative Zn-dependent peptidase [Rubidibacter lacunae KORDI 51-2]
MNRLASSSRRLWVGLLLLLAIASWSIAARADTSPVPPSASTSASIQPYLDRVSDRITEFTLDNGLQFVVLKDNDAPIVSFVTYADVGAVDEEAGKTGAAHFLEHLAFKGTERIGTTDRTAERTAIARLDALRDQLEAARADGKTDETIAGLQGQFAAAQQDADRAIDQNAYGRIIRIEGGLGLNAATSPDYTVYFCSLPANKLELWMSLESERFLEPVFREFYKEQQVILEERRQRTDDSPIGTLIESFLARAFAVHPYGRPTIGFAEDIRNLRREDIREFFARHYVPSKLTIAIAGDVDPVEVRHLAETYFGRFPARSALADAIPEEPRQQELREFELGLPSQPLYLEGYHRPALTHPDEPVYEILADLLGSGRTSRLYKSLVVEQQVALSVQTDNAFPGNRYPSLMLFYGASAPGRTLDELEAALTAELDLLKTEPVAAEELARVKTQVRASLLRSLDSPAGMARQLAEYQAKTGDWRNLFARVEQLAAVTPEDVQRIARATFVPENRTVGRLLSVDAPDAERPAES